MQHRGRKDKKINNKMKWLSWNMYTDYIYPLAVIYKKCKWLHLLLNSMCYLDTLKRFQHQQDNLTRFEIWLNETVSFLRALCVSAWAEVCLSAFGTCMDNSLLPYHGCMVHLLKYRCLICLTHSRLFPKPRMCACSCLDLVVLFYYLYSFLLL
jgi:hypothetical protein